jgi:hypothetical protein
VRYDPQIGQIGKRLTQRRKDAKAPRRKRKQASLLCAFAPSRLGVSLLNLPNLPNLRIKLSD